MNIYFKFVKVFNKDYMFKIILSIFIEIQAKLKIYFIISKYFVSRWNIIFLKIKINGVLNVLVAFHRLHLLIKIYLICKLKVSLKRVFANQFQTYL
jgi:hypothetical protein